MYLSLAKNQPNNRIHYIDTAIQNIYQAIEENRKIAHVLVTPDFETIRLAEQICTLTNQMLQTNGIAVEVDALHLKDEKLNDEQKLAIYRISQEQCSNIVKYAKAKLVTINLDSDNGQFKMHIADDGEGMETSKIPNGIGLRNIRSRLSTLSGNATIITAPSKGFVLDIAFPIG